MRARWAVVGLALVAFACGASAARGPGTRAAVAPPNGSQPTGQAAPEAAATPQATTDGFHAVAPVRVMDTRRPEQGGPAFGPGEVRNLALAGAAALAQAVAVALNVTVTQPSTTSFLTVWPFGTQVPDTSNLNVVANQTVANLVVVALGAGKVSVRNAFGTAHVIVDVMGWFAAGFEGVVPARLMDTRRGLGGLALGPGETRLLAIGGAGGVPSNASAVVVNVTAVQPTATGFLTVWPAGAALPGTSNLNTVPNKTVPNLVAVGLGAGQIAIRNAFGSTHVLVDVMGWFSSGFQPLTPARVADTRVGQCGVVLAAGDTREVAVAAAGGVPASGAGAVTLNLTVTQPATAGFLSVWPAGSAFPGTSNLNFGAGETAGNLVMVGVGASGRVAVRNGSPSTAHFIVDLMGWFDGATGYTATGSCSSEQPPPPGPKITKVLWIWEENSNPDLLIGTCPTCLEMPYLNSLAATYGQATNVRSASFPSLPNYIAATSGDYWGIADDSLPAKHPLSVPNLFLQLPPGQAVVYAESMTKNCQLDDGAKTDINGAGFYTARRTAFPYYTNARSLCQHYQVPLEGNLQAAVAIGLPSFSEVVPATCNNFHKGGTGKDACQFGPGQTYKTRADKWLQKTISMVITGPDWKAGRLAIFVVWDEGWGQTPPLGADCTVLNLGGCHIPLVVISPDTHSVKDGATYTTYSVLRTTEEILGLPLLEKAKTALSLRQSFGV